MYETKFMQRALELSHQGMTNGHGGPFGCVIVKDGIVVGEAHNEVLSSNDPTAHAELLAVRRASAKLQTFNLGGCELYTNGAPCCMCMSSMLWARVDRAYYVLSMDDSRSIGLGDEPFYEELARPLEQRQIIPMIQEPELRQEARAIYSFGRRSRTRYSSERASRRRSVRRDRRRSAKGSSASCPAFWPGPVALTVTPGLRSVSAKNQRPKHRMTQWVLTNPPGRRDTLFIREDSDGNYSTFLRACRCRRRTASGITGPRERSTGRRASTRRLPYEGRHFRSHRTQRWLAAYRN